MDVVLTQDFFPQIGGAHLWLHEVFRRWPRPVRVLTRCLDEPGTGELSNRKFGERGASGLEVVRRDILIEDIDLLRLSSLARINSVRRELARQASSATTVHCLRVFPEGLIGLLHKMTHRRSRLVVFAHGEEINVAKASRQLTLVARQVYRHADLVIANSRNTESLVRSLVPKARIECIHPGVECADFAAEQGAVLAYRSSLDWPAGTLIVGTVSRMEPRKNQIAVVEAISRLRSAGLPVAYVCAGDGETRGMLVERAEQLGIAQWCRFPGRLTEEDKLLMISASDVFAMPSVETGEMTEGFGIVFLEAAAAGIPSICGNVGGQPEAVLDGKTGYVVDGRDVSAVADAIRRLLENPTDRRRMSELARSWALQHDWSHVSDRVWRAVECMESGGKVDIR